MADENLQKKIAEAKAAGYTDEEIQNYLNPTPPAPVPQPQKQSLVDIMHQYNPQGFSQPMTPEQTGTAQFGAAQAAKYLGEGALGYGVYRGLKNIAQNFGKPSASSTELEPSTALEPGGQALRDFTTQQGRFTPPTSPNTVPPGYQPGQNVNINVGGNPATPAQTPGMMDRFGQLAQQYAPILQKYAGGLSRIAGPAALATYSRGLNTGEDEELKRQRARMEEAIRMEAARKAGIP